MITQTTGSGSDGSDDAEEDDEEGGGDSDCENPKYAALDETTASTGPTCENVGLSTISDESECRAAAEANGLMYEVMNQEQERPFGCHTTASSLGKWFFNRQENTNDVDHSDRLVCKSCSGRAVTTTTTTTTTSSTTTTTTTTTFDRAVDKEPGYERSCAVVAYCWVGDACDVYEDCIANPNARCCPGGQSQDRPQPTISFNDNANNWQTVDEKCWDFVRASSPRCQYEVATADGGTGRRFTFVGSAWVGETPGYDTIASIRIITEQPEPETVVIPTPPSPPDALPGDAKDCNSFTMSGVCQNFNSATGEPAPSTLRVQHPVFFSFFFFFFDVGG